MFSRALLVTLGVLAVIACSDSTGPASEISLARLAGTWDLSRLEMVLASDTSISQDVKGAFGLSATLTIQRSGRAVLVAQAPGQPDMTVSVTITLHGDTLVYEVEGSNYVVVVRMSDRTMSWRALASTYWDIDGDGSSDEVFERDVWHRR